MKFTSQDLAKAMGLKVGEKVVAEYDDEFEVVTKKLYSSKNGEWIEENIVELKCGSVTFNLTLLIGVNYTILQPKPILTEDEKVILRNLPKEYKWITRDCDGRDLCLHINKPERYSIHWSSKDGYNYLIPFNNLFNFIKWEDEQYSIEELLK